MDIRQLLTAYLQRDMFPFGKQTMQVAPENCDEEARRMLDWMAAQMNDRRSGVTFSGRNGSGGARCMVLKHKAVDELLCLWEDMPVVVGDRMVLVTLDCPGLTATLRKQSSGATLSV